MSISQKQGGRVCCMPGRQQVMSVTHKLEKFYGESLRGDSLWGKCSMFLLCADTGKRILFPVSRDSISDSLLGWILKVIDTESVYQSVGGSRLEFRVIKLVSEQQKKLALSALY